MTYFFSKNASFHGLYILNILIEGFSDKIFVRLSRTELAIRVI